MTIDEYFDRIFVINLARRGDRWQHCLEQFRKHDIRNFTRFEGYAGVIHRDVVNGNCGCTASHRALLEILAYHRWGRVLILEDDFEILHDDFRDRFAAMISEVPDDWDMLYLGGHYQEDAQSRVSEHVIRIGGMLTTSSYGITWRQARKMAPYVSGVGPIDSLYIGFNRADRCYIFQPRLMIQYPNYSDLQEKESDNSQCMQDCSHESRV